MSSSAVMNLKQLFEEKISKELLTEFALGNLLAVPRVVKVVVAVGLGEVTANPQVIDKVSEQLAAITGQKPQVTKARKSVSAFKLKAGQPIGLKVTLRGERMYQFLEKLFKIVLPRVRDFKGVKLSGFDRFANYNLGLSEQTLFPEIDYSKIDKIRGLQITIVTSTTNVEMAKALLSKMGLSFEKVGQ